MKQIIFRAFQFFLILSLTACAGTRVSKGKIDEAKEFSLKEVCDRYGLDFSWDSVTQAIFVNKGSRTASGLVGSEIIFVDDQKVVLSEPLKIDQGAVIVPRDFIEGVINLMVATADKKEPLRLLRKVTRVIVDPGHGGKDPGAIGHSGSHEKEIVLDISKRLKTLLKQKGIDVTMTRTTDVFISLKERTEIAAKERADLFVSIHANAHEKKSVNGMEVYSLRDLDVFERNDADRKENQELLFRHLKMKNSDSDLKVILSEMLYVYKQAQSVSLADDISRKTAGFIKAKNLGQKSSRFFVLRNTLIPAILIEVGYLTNPKEELLLKSEGYRQKIAYALARSILDYVKNK